MICPSCGNKMYEEGFPGAIPFEVCNYRTGCGYIFRAGEYAEPLYSPRENGQPFFWEQWRLELYRRTHQPLPAD